MMSDESKRTDIEWAIHSMNIHGTFFERWCQDAVRDTPGVQLVSTNYPVEFPPPNGPIRGKESSLDIRAQLVAGQTNLTFAIECKKNNPEFVDWILFADPNITAARRNFIGRIHNKRRTQPEKGWVTEISIFDSGTTLVIADDARETRGEYHNFPNNRTKTKTSNAAISKAAYQVALATKSLIEDEVKNHEALGNSANPPALKIADQYFIPFIVTTAGLQVCRFDPKDVDPVTGELPLGKPAFEKVPYLIYEYPLPRHLQSPPLDLVEVLSRKTLNQLCRMHIVVVNSSHFRGLLGDKGFLRKIGIRVG